ncbi:kinase-like domain-containing protein [Mycena vulgaris]|nr:kinase-like domain-containing protein [Mycena vulgaris]
MQVDSEPLNFYWGHLEPLFPNAGVIRIDFPIPLEAQDSDKSDELKQQVLTFGRGPDNNYVLHGSAISGFHATIQWNGRRDLMSVATLTNYSRNGTFVDGELVRYEHTHQLFEGSTVFFGSKVPVVSEPAADYRYIFHQKSGRSRTEKIFNDYSMFNQLGSGAFGTVHKVVEKKSGRLFAAKTAWKDSRQEITVMSASQETLAMTILEHPNICKLHDAFLCSSNRVADIVMEYVDGINLEEFLWNQRNPQKTRPNLRINELQAKELIYQICDAVAYMHGKGVAHCDLKPNNILIAGKERPMIKLVDLGLARMRGHFNMTQIVTDHLYTAPEAREQLTQYGNGVEFRQTAVWDSWAVGCLIHNLLADCHPYVPTNPKAPGFRRGVDWLVEDKLRACSPIGYDLARRFLFLDPEKRMLVVVGLTHPWFHGYVPYQVSFEGISFEKVSPSTTFDVPEEKEDEGMDEGEDGGGRPLRRLLEAPPTQRWSSQRRGPKRGPGELSGRPKATPRRGRR